MPATPSQPVTGTAGLLLKELRSSGITQIPTIRCPKMVTPIPTETSIQLKGTPESSSKIAGSESGDKQPPKEPERVIKPVNKSFKRSLFPDGQQDQKKKKMD
ncbi:hypothetical protein Tco_0518922 [Tanacetum coccineum]